MKAHLIDHIDLRVKNYQQALKFYRKLLPALGFTCERSDEEWATFYSAGGDNPSAFFGFTADPDHAPNGSRVAFWAETRTEVDHIAALAKEAGAINIEGPELCKEYSPGYYAVFFEDPDGNKLEVCCRETPIIKK
jgi:catechol 2,3-dioxygenase-like lactoylglutathione lyase family enzyme